jgi:hypothetical protein
MDTLKDLLDFWKSQIDKVILLVLIGAFLGVFVHMLHHKDGDAASLQWVEKSADMATGSLITLITGQIFNRKNGNGNGNGNVPPPSLPQIANTAQTTT